MRQRTFSAVVVLVAALSTLLWATQPTVVAADGEYRLTGPYTHNNLAIYLIHREIGDVSPVPLTLEEAMQQGLVKVSETNAVNELLVRNLGKREVFIQSGDIVKGGKQDRVLTVSMIIAPNSGNIPIGAFCVEHGRWASRGGENSQGVLFIHDTIAFVHWQEGFGHEGAS